MRHGSLALDQTPSDGLAHVAEGDFVEVGAAYRRRHWPRRHAFNGRDLDVALDDSSVWSTAKRRGSGLREQLIVLIHQHHR